MAIPTSLLPKRNFCFPHPGIRRGEILNGNLVPIPPPETKHQAVSLRLALALLRHVEAEKLGQVFQAPYNVVLSRSNVIQPDLLFIQKERRGLVSEKCLCGAPDLVIEVLSQNTRERDVKIKRKIYAEFEIPEYWIVDPAIETVEVLVWSEIGYLSARVYGNPHRLSSPMMPLNIPISCIFNIQY